MLHFETVRARQERPERQYRGWRQERITPPGLPDTMQRANRGGGGGGGVIPTWCREQSAPPRIWRLSGYRTDLFEEKEHTTRFSFSTIAIDTHALQRWVVSRQIGRIEREHSPGCDRHNLTHSGDCGRRQR